MLASNLPSGSLSLSSVIHRPKRYLNVMCLNHGMEDETGKDKKYHGSEQRNRGRSREADAQSDVVIGSLNSCCDTYPTSDTSFGLGFSVVFTVKERMDPTPQGSVNYPIKLTCPDQDVLS